MFSSKEQENNFAESLETAIRKMTKKASGLKMAHYSLSIATLMLSAILTIILGFHLKNDVDLILSKNIALILGALITFLTGVNAFWKLESYWVRRKILLRRLEDLRDEFTFQKLSANKEDLDSLFAKYQSIQNYQTLYWEDIYNEGKTVQKTESSTTMR
jgi:Protein of unknown function (DUF4231)